MTDNAPREPVPDSSASPATLAGPPAAEGQPAAHVGLTPNQTRMRNLHPGWFASVVGTAIVAVATYNNPGNVTALRGVAHGIGVGVAVLAYALGIVLTVAYAIR